MLIVETGTGEDPDSNSYVDVPESEDILIELGYDVFPSETDLIQATLYIDTWLSPISSILDDEQPLLWPREEFKDRHGRKVTGIPFELKRATSIIAAEFIEDDLFNPSTPIIEEQYGNSRTRYASPASQESKRTNSAIARLKKLGYGSNSIRLIRA